MQQDLAEFLVGSRLIAIVFGDGHTIELSCDDSATMSVVQQICSIERFAGFGDSKVFLSLIKSKICETES